MAQHPLVVICTHAFNDPLVRAVLYPYIQDLQSNGLAYEILLLTEEGKGYDVTNEQMQEMRELQIHWEPLNYNVKGQQWLQRFRNLIASLRIIRRFLGQRRGTIIGYLSFAGTYALLINGCLRRCRTMTLCFEPHSNYMVELGIWPKNSLKAKLVHLFERLQIRHIDELIVPTKAVVDLVRKAGRVGAVHLKPIAIDVKDALFDPIARNRIRKEQMWRDEFILAYAGKFGGLYYTCEEYINFVERLAKECQELHFMIITGPEDLSRIRSLVAERGIENIVACFDQVPPAELPQLLSAADAGVVAIPPSASQVYRTPVKTAYYWAAGLPIVVPAGVGDEDDIVRKHEVGVVVEDIVTLHPSKLVLALKHYMDADRAEVRARCMQVALQYRDKVHMVDLLKELLMHR